MTAVTFLPLVMVEHTADATGPLPIFDSRLARFDDLPQGLCYPPPHYTNNNEECIRGRRVGLNLHKMLIIKMAG